jgi:hypothetical protein
MSKGAPTTRLHSHRKDCAPLKRLIKDSEFAEGGDGVMSMLQGQGQKPDNLPLTKPTAQQVREQVLKFFVSGNIPFNQASNPQFKRIVEWVTTKSGESVLVSRKTVRAHLESESEVAKQDLKSTLKALDSKISLALDNWTSRNGYAFMGISPR